MGANGIPVIAYADTGRPLTMAEIDERFTEYGIGADDVCGVDTTGARDTWEDVGAGDRVIPEPDDPRISKAMDSELGELAVMAPDTGRNARLNKTAYKLGRLPIPRDDLRGRLLDACRANGLLADDGETQCRATIKSGFAAADRDGLRTMPAGRVQLDDAHIAQHIAGTTLSDRYCWCSSLGWMRYNGTHWERASEAAVHEQVRRAVITLHAREARQRADPDRLRRISALFAAGRIRAVASLARGILEVRDEEFDAHLDLLNVGNGVIDLRTGELKPHHPALMLTRHTKTHYRADATHPDWSAALAALPAESAEWMQQRVGQAATGHPTPDDIMPVMQGSGENGKTTMLGAVTGALGDHAVTVPERVLLANPSDHPTELMTLRGARLAVMEETPEARHLNVKRLKDTLGTTVMTARHIGKDSVSWSPTHSLVLSTNYRPRVDETDHGTWRRLALVRFPYTFRKPGTPLAKAHEREGDPTLRDRLRQGRDGRREAVLAWIVQGAVAWYANGCVLPPAPAIVAADTSAWREDSDAILGFISENLTFDDSTHIATTDLLRVFNDWLRTRGQREWSDQTLSARLKDHDAWHRVEHQRVLASKGGLSRPSFVAGEVKKQYRAWVGVRFRTPGDPVDDPEESPGNGSNQPGLTGLTG